MSDVVYLIWLLRDECRIQKNDTPSFAHFEEEMMNQWYERLNTRSTEDRAVVSLAKFTKKALGGNLVTQVNNQFTWYHPDHEARYDGSSQIEKYFFR